VGTLYGYLWDKDTCATARNGYFEILKWAHLNGCPWDKDTCTYAASNSHFEILKWACLNECPIDYKICIKDAKEAYAFMNRFYNNNYYNKWDKKSGMNYGVMIS
jgi:hypothetical protein